MAIKDALQQYPDQTGPFYEFQSNVDLSACAGAIGTGFTSTESAAGYREGEDWGEVFAQTAPVAQAALGLIDNSQAQGYDLNNLV